MKVSVSDEFELEFSGLSQASYEGSESSRAGALQFSSWNQAEIFFKP